MLTVYFSWNRLKMFVLENVHRIQKVIINKFIITGYSNLGTLKNHLGKGKHECPKSLHFKSSFAAENSLKNLLFLSSVSVRLKTVPKIVCFKAKNQSTTALKRH